MDFGALSMDLSRGGTQERKIGTRQVKDSSRMCETYTMLEEIGHGQYGVVTKAKHRSRYGFFAVKHIDKAKAGAKGLSSVFSEVETLTMLHHPGIVALEDVFMDDNNLWIVMEYAGGGDLYEALKKLPPPAKGFPEAQVRKWCVDLLLAVEYIHSKGIAHRDLKLSNILLSENQQRCKLVDFGFAILVGQESVLTSFCGTTAYMAPEIIASVSYGKPVDMWALGVILHHLLCGELPFVSAPGEPLEEQILKGAVMFHQAAWNDISQGAKDLVSKLLVVDPAKRFSAQEGLRHYWVRLSMSGDDFESELLRTSSLTTGASPASAAAAKSKRARQSLRAGILAVQAAHRLVFAAKILSLKREGLDLALLRSFSYLVGRHYDPNSRTLVARAVCPGSIRTAAQICSMLECSTTLEAVDVSYNNLDSVDIIQQIVRVASTHPSLTSINLEGNPIPALAGRSLVRLARSNPKLKAINIAHTGLPSEIQQQLVASLKRPLSSAAPTAAMLMTQQGPINTTPPSTAPRAVPPTTPTPSSTSAAMRNGALAANGRAPLSTSGGSGPPPSGPPGGRHLVSPDTSTGSLIGNSSSMRSVGASRLRTPQGAAPAAVSSLPAIRGAISKR